MGLKVYGNAILYYLWNIPANLKLCQNKAYFKKLRKKVSIQNYKTVIQKFIFRMIMT